MRSTAPMKAAKTGYIIISAIMIALGIFMIIMPQTSVSLVGTVCAIFMIVCGIIKLIGYFSKDLFRLTFQYDLIYGVLLIVLGAVMLLHPENLIKVICVVIGVAVLFDGLTKVQTAMDSKRFGLKYWWLIMAAAIFSCIIGAFMLFRPFDGAVAMAIMIGISLVIDGVTNLCTAITAIKIIDHQVPDVMEAEFREKEE